MSLFENPEYQWRDTYFILFEPSRRPAASKVEAALRQLNVHHQINSVRSDKKGHLESLTLEAPDDYAGMDITYVEGPEVTEHVSQLVRELKASRTERAPAQLLEKLTRCTCRFDVYHFEQLVFFGRSEGEDDDEFLDPGSLLIVLEKVASLCDGVVVDPQANAIL